MRLALLRWHGQEEPAVLFVEEGDEVVVDELQGGGLPGAGIEVLGEVTRGSPGAAGRLELAGGVLEVVDGGDDVRPLRTIAPKSQSR